MNHIYEYKKGVRRLVLYTFNKKYESFAITRLERQNIDYIIQPVGNDRLNLFFGKKECLDAIRMIITKPLCQLTPEEDFILGAMLGYDICAQCERYLKERLEVVWAEEIPTRKIPEITDEPLIWRYFATPLRSVLRSMQLDEQEYIARIVMHINRAIDGAYVFSSGKDMGCFKAVGYPEDVGRFYKLDEYEGYSWTAHGRYPTNTPGWWGGAHPFGLLNWSVVHNGEISSYDANRRFIEMYGYHCALQTDTEVITYIVDYLLRRQGLTLEETASVIAAPFWSTISRKSEPERQQLTYLRKLFPSLLVTGPFSIVLGFEGGLMALNDRLKLRSMVVGEKNDKVYIASEEAAIRTMEPDVEHLYAPAGGEPVIVRVKEGVV